MDHAQFEHLKTQVSAASAARICPHCQCNDIVLYGKDQNGRQRFKCRGCRRTYNILTGTTIARARKPEKWGHYLGCMTEHMSLRKIVASGIDVHLITAWRWRHRFLKAAANDTAAVLSGVIEVDTTFFQRSFKGSRDASRAFRATPRSGAKPCSSREKVPVLTALDSTGSVFDAILESITEIEAALDGRIDTRLVLCSDGSAAYVNVAEKAGAQHLVFVPATTPDPASISVNSIQAPDPGRLWLQRVSSHHQRQKHLINEKCRGVATKYLVHYLGWHRAMIRPGFDGTILLDRALR